MMHSSGLDQIRRSLQLDNDSLDKTLAGMNILIWRIFFLLFFNFRFRRAVGKNFTWKHVIVQIFEFLYFSGLDSRLDKQRFFESNNATFMIPKKFEYNPGICLLFSVFMWNQLFVYFFQYLREINCLFTFLQFDETNLNPWCKNRSWTSWKLENKNWRNVWQRWKSILKVQK